jgi:hypothetical protein
MNAGVDIWRTASGEWNWKRGQVCGYADTESEARAAAFASKDKPAATLTRKNETRRRSNGRARHC